MAVKPFTREELNFFKFSSIVLDEFPKMLRETFIKMWGTKIAALPGYMAWDDSLTVRNLLLKREGGKTDIPTNKSINDWDCTALFKATIYSNTFGRGTSKSTKTLSQQYLKGKKPSPFHSSVISASGNQDETVTLALDQLRLLRNALCHTPKPTLALAKFSNFIQLVKDAFTACGVSVARIDEIGCLGEEDFPTEQVNELNDRMKIEEQENTKFMLETNTFLQETSMFLQHEMTGAMKELVRLQNAMFRTPPDSCVPQIRSDFVGRSEECNAVIISIMSQPTRLFSIWGSPGFGKTSTAIAIGNQLMHQGQHVYYFSFRGVSIMKEFTSKLLGLFGRSSNLHHTVNLTPADQLLRAFESISEPLFIILDNLDELLTSSSQNEEMLNFIIEVIQRCPSMRLITTTRRFPDFFNFRVEEFHSLRLKPLEAQASASLILKLLPQSATADLQSQISRMCGNVPLAIRLLCSLIKDSPGEFLDEIRNGAECFLDVIDGADYPHDFRLKELIQILFKKLSDVEKGAFISLSIFGGAEFGLDAGRAIVGGSKFHANKNIESLKKKSLIDVDSEMYSIHPLIQSFALEKGQNEMKNVLASSRARFFEYYINLFQSLNIRFLKGDSMAAFKAFYAEEQRILSSLNDGLNDSEFLEKVFGVLKECEFFLDSVCSNSSVKNLYNYALSKVPPENKFHKDFAGLHSSRKFFDTIFVSKTFSPLPLEDDETSRKIALLPLSVQGKLECYKGIYELSNGGGEPAAQHIENGLLQLDNNPQHVILKVLGFQILAIYYKYTNNSVKCERFLKKTVETCTANSVFRHVPLLGKPLKNKDKIEGSCFGDQPLAVWAIARLSVWTRKYPWVKLGTEFGNSVDSFLKQVTGESTKLVWTVELCTLLQLVDKAYIYLGISSDLSTYAESESYHGTKDEDPQKRLLRQRQARNYHTLAVRQYSNGESILESSSKELEIRQQLPLDGELAGYYRLIGVEQTSRGKYASAVQSHKSALEILQKLHGEMHEEVANSYCDLALAQYSMGDSESSLQSYRSALIISVYLYGEFHWLSAMIEERINDQLESPLIHGRNEGCPESTQIATLMRRSSLDVRSLEVECAGPAPSRWSCSIV